MPGAEAKRGATGIPDYLLLGHDLSGETISLTGVTEGFDITVDPFLINDPVQGVTYTLTATISDAGATSPTTTSEVVKVFRGDHGWTVADSPVYNYDEDDASWERLLELYETAL